MNPQIAGTSAALPAADLYECLSPLATRVATTLPMLHVPFSLLVSQPTHVSFTEFYTEINTLVRAMPIVEEASTDSKTLVKIRQHLRENSPALVGKEAALFYLAVVGTSKMFELWTGDSGGDVGFFLTIQNKIAERPESAAHTMGAILTYCIEYDLRDRFYITRNLVMDLPSFTHEMRDMLLIFLGHFHRGWVDAYMKQMRLPDKTAKRVQELIRDDIGSYCLALTRIAEEEDKWKTPYLARFQKSLELPTTLTRALAFTSRHPVEVWQGMGWTCAPDEQRAMVRLSNAKYSITVEEAVELTLSVL